MSTLIGDFRSFTPRTSDTRKTRVRMHAWRLLFIGGILSSEMPIWDHLEELRRRILKSLIAVGVATLLCGAYASQLIEFMARSAREAGIELIAIDSTEVFSLYFKVALAGGICLASPVVLWQAWRFVAPALYPHERRYAGPFIFLTTVCFVGGAVFGYVIVAPWVIKLQLVMAEQTHVIRFTPTALRYFSFLTATIISMGLVFEMPPVTLILSRIGLVKCEVPPKTFQIRISFLQHCCRCIDAFRGSAADAGVYGSNGCSLCNQHFDGAHLWTTPGIRLVIRLQEFGTEQT